MQQRMPAARTLSCQSVFQQRIIRICTWAVYDSVRDPVNKKAGMHLKLEFITTSEAVMHCNIHLPDAVVIAACMVSTDCVVFAPMSLRYKPGIAVPKGVREVEVCLTSSG